MLSKLFFSSDKDIGKHKTDSVGSITVAELDWGNKEHIKAVGPPFDYIIGTDVVSFLMQCLESFLNSTSQIAGPTSDHAKLSHNMPFQLYSPQ